MSVAINSTAWTGETSSTQNWLISLNKRIQEAKATAASAFAKIVDDNRVYEIPSTLEAKYAQIDRNNPEATITTTVVSTTGLQRDIQMKVVLPKETWANLLAIQEKQRLAEVNVDTSTVTNAFNSFASQGLTKIYGIYKGHIVMQTKAPSPANGFYVRGKELAGLAQTPAVYVDATYTGPLALTETEEFGVTANLGNTDAIIASVRPKPPVEYGIPKLPQMPSLTLS